MTSAQSPALDQALSALRAPGLYLRLRERPLPEDILLLLKIAAGESESRELACDSSGETAGVVVEAAVLYIQQVMFYPGSDSHRLLGVSTAAVDSQIKEHYRWLVRWLHPDRNTEQWDAVYADRVNRAWQDLRTPERRKDYESQLAPSPAFADWQPEAGALVESRPAGHWPAQEEFLLSTRTTRRLPLLIMGGLVVAASAALGLQYQLTKKEARAEAVAIALPAGPDMVPMETPPQPAPAPQQQPPPTQLPPLRQMTPAPSIEPAATKAIAKTSPTKPPDRIAKSPAKPVADPAPAAVAPLPRSAIMAPATVAVTAAPARDSAPAAAPAHRSLINSAVANDVIMRFRSAYSSGNINQFRDLLASGPVSDPRERSTILRSYAKLFETSERRRIEIHDADWLTDGDTAVLIASYDAWIVPRGDSRERHFFGNIRFDLRSEDGELRVARLRHDSVGG